MKSLLRRISRIPLIWYIIEKTLGKISQVYLKLRSANEEESEERAALHFKFLKHFPENKVHGGPFEGMRYPKSQSIGSAFYPKIIGTYEAELSGIVAHIITQPYTSIIDIGCAEGYYAVGLGMHCKDARVYAFDTNEEALRLCEQMAEVNGVDVITSGLCSKQTLLGLELGTKALIFCDCEGYETELIDLDLANKLISHDFLVETHDFLRVDITEKILHALSSTHDCEVVESLDDIAKAYTYSTPRTTDFPLNERLEIFAEGRPTVMRWIFAKART